MSGLFYFIVGLSSRTASKPAALKTKSKPLKTVIYPTSALPPLGPGTLILGNGLAVPVLPQPQSLLPNPSNLILNSTLYSIPKVVQTQQVTAPNNKNVTSKTLPYIKPKYCLTRTTQVNKVPIPALTSPYASNYCLFNESKVEPGKKDLSKVKKVNKVTDQVGELNKSDTKKSNKRKHNEEEEITNKISKNDVDSELSNNKPVENDTVAVSLPIDIPVSNSTIQEDSTKINMIQSNDAVEKEVEKLIPDEPKVSESNEKSEIIRSENTETEGITPFDTPEKVQETITNQNNENPQISLIETSTVITTSTTVATSATMATHDDMKTLEINLPHSELSNDIFASLQVPSGCQNPESTSPTAAFLLAFPLVSSGVKVTEVIDGENSESHSVTPTLLQIGTMDTTKSTQSQSDVITSNFLNLDSFSFFSAKDICGSFDNNYPIASSSGKSQPTMTNSSSKSDSTNNTSIYVNVKSPCLPTCVAQPVKQNCNIYCQKTAETSKDTNKEVKDCEKPNSSQKFNVNSIYNPQIQPTAKPDLNFHLPKVAEMTQKTLDQKSQYQISSTYSQATCDFSYKPDLTKTCVVQTCSYSNINRNYTNPLYTNCNNYNYNYHPDTNFNQNYYKNISQNETKTYYPLNYDNYSDYRKNDSTALAGKYYDTSAYMKEKKTSNVAKVKLNDNKQPINWMTAPDNRLQTSECLLTSFSKGNFNQTYPFASYTTSATTYFPTTTMETNKMNCALETKKCLDLPIVSLNSHQRLDIEEKQFSWSPTKLPHFLDPPHTFVTSTLPTLVGDLALGNTLPFAEQKTEFKSVKENKDFRQISKVNNYENQSNFLSVSQLVDHSKPETIAAKPTSRRNSGNRSKSNVQQKSKRVTKHDNKDMLPHCGVNNDNMHQSRSTNNFNTFSSIDLFTDQKHKNSHKNSSSSYSAEALIGNQVPDESVNKRYPVANKSLGASSFLAENIISYFPPVDLPQDNYMSQNQNYQANSFTTSFQNNAYSSNSFIYTASTIASSYLGTNNFDPGPQDYLPDSINLISNPSSKDNKHYNGKSCSKPLNKEEKNNHYPICSNNMKRTKRKSTNDANNTLFDFPFLPIPGSNNSPILPDDFHSHTNFLAPTTPFSCKNSLYPKQNNDIGGASLLPLPPVCRNTIQHPEISPSVNAVGPSLTNFNLSTIFPEINKVRVRYNGM